jgi:hypothetical protein
MVLDMKLPDEPPLDLKLGLLTHHFKLQTCNAHLKNLNPDPNTVLQVFDCGCIGEGALHIVAAARKHLKPGGRVLPASAQVNEVEVAAAAAMACRTSCHTACRFQVINHLVLH